MITKKEAGTVNGKAVAQYTLENENGLAMTFYTYGGIIQSLLVKDRQGIARDVELGFATLDEYVKAACYYGAPIGRYANRIGGAKFTMDGREYHLTANENGNTLHGGNGLTFRVWQAVKEEDGGEPSVTLRVESPDGEDGFPGNLTMEMTYTLTADNGVRIEYRGTTDQKTPVNMTNHSFFNLSGEGETALDHVLGWTPAAIPRPTRLCFPPGSWCRSRELPLILPLPRPSARRSARMTRR